MKPSELLALFVDLKDLKTTLEEIEEGYDIGLAHDIEKLKEATELIYDSLREGLE